MIDTAELGTRLTTAKVLHLFRKELESYGFPENIIAELVIHAGKSVVDEKGLGVSLDV